MDTPPSSALTAADASDISVLKVPSFSVTRNLIQTLANTVGDIYKRCFTCNYGWKLGNVVVRVFFNDLDPTKIFPY